MTDHEVFEHHEHPFQPEHQEKCRTCTNFIDTEHPVARFGFCHHCVYKILIFVVVCMVIVSYVVWYSLF